jgi:hypothetical protein
MNEFPVEQDWLITAAEGYSKFRGKCKELSEAAVAADQTLTLVRGYYFCPIWNSCEAHWWTVRSDGSIYDPTKEQFPSRGAGIYTPFDGTIKCSQCGKRMTENEAAENSVGNYALCSWECYVRCCL